MSKICKKVLVITYYFPPSGGAGVQRTLKFVKYLREFGWEPVVLTAKNADYPAYDESLLSEIPEGIKVYRSRIFEPYRLYRKFTSRKAEESTDIATLSLGQKSKQKLSERLSEWIRATFFIPDARIGWLFFAYLKGKRILKKENVRIIYSSAPPYTTHLIGKMLHRTSKLPWVVDFRDSWIGWVSTPQWRPKLSLAIEMQMEASVLRHADRILTVTRGIKEDLLSRHPEFRSQVWHLLPNGFDAADFDSIQPKKKDGVLTITYSGSLYGPRNPESLLRALELLQVEDPEITNKVRIRIVGRVGESVISDIQVSPVKDSFEIVGYLPHKESLEYLLSADLLLLIIDNARVSHLIIPGKVYEYIGTGLPILALAPEGETAELIRSNDLGYVFDLKDVSSLRETLSKLITAKGNSQNLTMNNKAFQKKCERREHTRKLAEIFDEMVEK
ncbi:MAG: glycosyltransferase [Caldithrix sp.]|nr:MAG: glycosyltransferase [Caldithrix sp.]